MELIATEAREIDKQKVTDPEYIAVNGQFVADIRHDDQMKAGEYYVTAIVSSRSSPIRPPDNFLSKLWWMLFGTTHEETPEILRRLVISCPFCGMAILIDSGHILTVAPLTLTSEIQCPYAPRELGYPHAFEIKEGKITSA
jgi:hypothetical protein